MENTVGAGKATGSDGGKGKTWIKGSFLGPSSVERQHLGQFPLTLSLLETARGGAEKERGAGDLGDLGWHSAPWATPHSSWECVGLETAEK